MSVCDMSPVDLAAARSVKLLQATQADWCVVRREVLLQLNVRRVIAFNREVISRIMLWRFK